MKQTKSASEEKLKKELGNCIWTLSEFFGIGLGRFAPTVFGWMIGSKPHKSK